MFGMLQALNKQSTETDRADFGFQPLLSPFHLPISKLLGKKTWPSETNPTRRVTKHLHYVYQKQEAVILIWSGSESNCIVKKYTCKLVIATGFKPRV